MQDKKFVAILVGVEDEKCEWAEPIIFDKILHFPKKPRIHDFAPEMSKVFDNVEEAVEAARRAGALIFDAPLWCLALDYFDNLGLLIKGSPEEFKLNREDFYQQSYGHD